VRWDWERPTGNDRSSALALALASGMRQADHEQANQQIIDASARRAQRGGLPERYVTGETGQE